MSAAEARFRPANARAGLDPSCFPQRGFTRICTSHRGAAGRLSALDLSSSGRDMREIARSQRPALHTIFGALAVSFFLQGCATVAITGRTQLNMLSDAEIVAMGDRSFSAFMALAKKENRVVNPGESPQAAAAIANVRQVSDRIIDAAGLRAQYSWEIVVI